MIRYPNGKVYNAVPKQAQPHQKNKDVSFSNRGQTLEDEINETNNYYLGHHIANIHKKPVPVQIVKVEYPARSAAVIREAYFRTPSTTDYNGVWEGHYIDFEAKETQSTTSFPLKNIHAHQVEHMRHVIKQRGIAFFIIRFSSLNRYFVVSFQLIDKAWHHMENGGRKSVTLETFEKEAIEIQIGYQPRLDYLQAVQQFIGKNSDK